MRGGYDAPFIYPSQTATQTKPLHQRPVFGPPRPRPTVLLLNLSLNADNNPDPPSPHVTATLTAALTATGASVTTATSIPEARATLTASPRPAAVVAADACLLDGKTGSGADVLLLLGRYVRSGGTLVLNSTFAGPGAGTAAQRRLKGLFSGVFGLTWEPVESRTVSSTTTLVLNRGACDGLVTAGLPRRLACRKAAGGLLLGNVAPSAAVYSLAAAQEGLSPAETLLEDDGLTPVALAACGRGKVGYVGDVSPEREMTAVIVALCGLGGSKKSAFL